MEIKTLKKEDFVTILKEEISKETGLAINKIDDHAEFYSLGLDSVSCVYILDIIEKKINLELNPLYFWDYNTIDLLSAHLATLTGNE